MSSGCEGAPGPISLRLDELESEEEEDDDEYDDDDEEGIEMFCTEELGQVLELPVSIYK